MNAVHCWISFLLVIATTTRWLFKQLLSCLKSHLVSNVDIKCLVIIVPLWKIDIFPKSSCLILFVFYLYTFLSVRLNKSTKNICKIEVKQTIICENWSQGGGIYHLLTFYAVFIIISGMFIKFVNTNFLSNFSYLFSVFL